MDMMSQLVGQALNGFVKVPAAPQAKTGEAADFDSMIRSKYQQAEGQKTQEQPEAEKNTDAGMSKPAEASETEQPTEQIAEPAEAGSQPAKVEDMKQQYELAAALMAQAQPVVYDVQPQVVAVAEEVQPQMKVAVGEIETALPVQGQQAVVEQPIPEAVAETAGMGVLVEHKAAEAVEAKPVETKAEVEAEPVETKAKVEAEPVEAKVETEAKPMETKAEVEAKPVETVETKAKVEAKPVEVKAEVEAPKEAVVGQAQEKPQAGQQEQAGKQEMSSDPNNGNAEKPVKVIKTQETPITDDTTEDTEVQTEEESVEAPVFEKVEATPVKVAEAPGKPVDVQADDAPQQIADKLEVPLQEGESRVVINLTPENLGRVTVEITRAGDGSLSVVLSASTPKAASLLEHHSTGLQQLLAANNDADVRIEVRGGQENQPQYMDPNGRNGQQQSQQQHQQRQQPQEEHQVQDFIQQLRLGLVSLEEDAS